MAIRNKLLNINDEDYNSLLSALKNNPDYESFFEEQFKNIDENIFSEEDKKEIGLMSNAEKEDIYDSMYRGFLDSIINNALARLVILIGLISSFEITESRTNFLYQKMILILDEQTDDYKKILKLTPVDLEDINSNFNEELLVNICNEYDDAFNLGGKQNNYLRDDLFVKKRHIKRLRRTVRNQIIFILNNFYNDNLHNQEITYKQFKNYKKKILKLCRF
jgi:hypothetical protein